MKTVEEFLKEKYPFLKNQSLNRSANNISYSDIIKRIIEYTQEAIKEDRKNVAEYAITKDLTKPNCDDHTPYWGVCSSCGSYDNYEIMIGSCVDKDSIINAPQTELK